MRWHHPRGALLRPGRRPHLLPALLLHTGRHVRVHPRTELEVGRAALLPGGGERRVPPQVDEQRAVHLAVRGDLSSLPSQAIEQRALEPAVGGELHDQESLVPPPPPPPPHIPPP